MARGTMFHITTDPECVGTMTALDFYEDIGSLGVDCVMDHEKQTAARNVTDLRLYLEKCGFHTIPDDNDDEDARDTAAFLIVTGDEDALSKAKIRYFAPMLAELKKQVAAIKIEEFASPHCNTYGLKRCIDDTYHDTVYFESKTYGGSTYTMDSFIRNMEPDTMYFVSANTVLMH